MAYVSLTTGGRYLRLGTRCGEDRLLDDAGSLDSADLFERLELPHGRVALRTRAGHYLTRRPDRGQNFGLYPEPDLSPAAVFEEILWPDGKVSLRSADLTYVSAHEAPTGVTVNRVEPGPSERFGYVAAAAMPTQGPRHSDVRRTPAPL
jgi:hypothetical protein